MPSIEARACDFDPTPAKDDILVLDGTAFIVLCRQFSNSQGYIFPVLVIDPIDLSRTY